jgi:hypothetical protein
MVSQAYANCLSKQELSRFTSILDSEIKLDNKD